MPARTLSERELRLAVLARQGLLERSDGSLTSTIERVGCLQTQYAPSAYIGLWSRLRGFERVDLTRALESRRVIQAWLMRVTIHMCTKRDYWPIVEAVRGPRRDWWRRATRHAADERAMLELADRVRHALADGPRRRKEIVDELGLDSTTWNGVGLWIDLVRVPPSGTWEQRRADLFALAEDWVGPSDATPDQGIDLLARRYLGAFGPAGRADIANWAGLPVATVAASLGRMKLRRFLDESGGELLDLPRAPLPHLDTPAPVRFIPTFDAILMVHRRCTQILRDEDRPRVFNTRTPHSMPTFTVDGQVEGTWRFADGSIRIEPFRTLTRRARRDLDDEAGRLATFMAD
jgi:Winged helix DNA-binding domain